MSTSHVEMAEAELLAHAITKIPESIRDVEALRKKGPLTRLPESLLTLRDIRAVTRYISLRSRITLIESCNVEIQVPVCVVDDVESELNLRRVFGTVIAVRALGFWDHVFLWRTVVRSKVPV